MRLRSNLNVGHHRKISDDMPNDFVIKFWQIASHSRDQSEPINHYDDGLIKRRTKFINNIPMKVQSMHLFLYLNHGVWNILR